MPTFQSTKFVWEQGGKRKGRDEEKRWGKRGGSVDSPPSLFYMWVYFSIKESKLFNLGNLKNELGQGGLILEDF